MSRAGLVVGLVAAAALAQPGPPAYLPFKMLNGASDPFKYYLDNRTAMPGNLTQNAIQAATENAWNTWNGVTCAVPKASRVGFTSGIVPNPPDPYDKFNVTPVWVVANNDPYFQMLGPFVKGTALPTTYAGVLTSCEIYLNGVGTSWSTQSPTAMGSVDLETVMLHEAGHCLGLDHYGGQAFPSAMVGSVVEGFERRTLFDQDRFALCDRNAIQGRIGSPCLTDGGCGSTISGIKCVTQPLATGSAKFCTVGCATGTGAVCELPLYCEPASFFSPAQNGACLRAVDTVTRIGAPCTMNDQCSSSIGLCQPEGTQPSGFKRWAQGYCFQTCAPGQPACPAGSQCTDVGGTQPVCLLSCRVGLADCRFGYSCAQSVNGGVCIPSCFQDVDCGDVAKFQCRTCDGLCVNRQNSSGQIGDICSNDLSCGAGQLCIRPEPAKPTKLCTLSCGSGCGTCPTGSACHPIPPTNALTCLRTCTGAGTCPTGTRCANLPTGRACMAPCNPELVDSQCPLGQECIGGDCYNPGEDAGCGTFCEVVDSGRPIVVPKKDGGTGGGGGGGGCGCSTSPELGALLGFLLALAGAGRGRRRR